MNLLYFILGIIFYNTILPLLQALCEYLNLCIKNKEIVYQQNITKSNLEIEEMTNRSPTEGKNKIGFQEE